MNIKQVILNLGTVFEIEKMNVSADEDKNYQIIDDVLLDVCSSIRELSKEVSLDIKKDIQVKQIIDMATLELINQGYIKEN